MLARFLRLSLNCFPCDCILRGDLFGNQHGRDLPEAPEFESFFAIRYFIAPFYHLVMMRSCCGVPWAWMTSLRRNSYLGDVIPGSGARLKQR